MFFEKDIKSVDNHSLQFQIWRYSGKSRIIVEVLLGLVFMYFTFYTCQDAIRLETPVIDAIGNVTAME